MFKEIFACRVCGSSDLTPILSLGNQVLTGVFPSSKDESVTKGPLDLVKCDGECGLVQLKHTYDSSEMYGVNYGYRSGLNNSMIQHLKGIAAEIQNRISLKEGDLVLDIGSNDSTSLQNYPEHLTLVGIDPVGVKFKNYYPSHIQLIEDFFSSEAVKNRLGDKKAKVITSIAMFYDLEDPVKFCKDIAECLDDNGVWVFEQSYLLSMIEAVAYDTICHEHIEYYALKQIEIILDRAGLKAIDVSLNNANGGSFRITAAKKNTSLTVNEANLNEIRELEKKNKLDEIGIYNQFRENTERHKEELRVFFDKAKEQGKKVFGYGASTKGNVILQYCGISEEDLPFIAEVNEDKFGKYTPGTLIPIQSEAELRKMKPDYFMVLPWHFKEGLIKKEIDFTNDGGKLVFPLPKLEVYP